MRLCFAGGFGHYDHAADTKEIIVGVLISPDDTAGYREFCKDKKGYTDYVEMLEAEKPDAVVIDSKNCDHFYMAREALLRGIPAFCEKPVCLELRQVKELEDAAKKGKALLYGMFTTRFEAPFYTAKNLVSSGAIGNIRLINGQKTYILGKREPFCFEPEKFGNTFSWIGIHSVEQALWICGKNLTSSSYYHRKSKDKNIDDCAVCVCEFEDVIATFTADYLRPEGAGAHGDDRLRIVGDSGTVEVMNGKVTLTDKNGTREVPLILPEKKIFEDFLDAVRGISEPVCTTSDTLAATAAVLEITR